MKLISIALVLASAESVINNCNYDVISRRFGCEEPSHKALDCKKFYEKGRITVETPNKGRPQKKWVE